MAGGANLRRYLYLGILTQLGWVMAFSIVLCLALGIWVDSRFDTKPLFTLSLLFLGIIIGSLSVYNTIRSSMKEIQRPEEE